VGEHLEPVSGAGDRREQQAELQALLQETLFRRWRAVVAWVLMAAGFIAILVAWYQVRDLPEVFLQMPYLISGGVGGAVLIGLGAALLITQDFRDDKQRLESLERKIAEMEDVVVTQAEIIGEAIAILSAAAEGAEGEVRRAVWRRGRG
jgi:hypothetical protein